MRGSRLRGNDGGLTLILTFSPQGRRDHTGGRDAEPVSEVAPKALTSFVQDDIRCQERL